MPGRSNLNRRGEFQHTAHRFRAPHHNFVPSRVQCARTSLTSQALVRAGHFSSQGFIRKAQDYPHQPNLCCQLFLVLVDADFAPLLVNLLDDLGIFGGMIHHSSGIVPTATIASASHLAYVALGTTLSAHQVIYRVCIQTKNTPGVLRALPHPWYWLNQTQEHISRAGILRGINGGFFELAITFPFPIWRAMPTGRRREGRPELNLAKPLARKTMPTNATINNAYHGDC
ncbi:hypothetical protein BJ166DRAFT_388954 [Pestalotiopsis sp. NC0098]|nr:hypothetical protein BJ166DRAFT_388954 [Pestalotiopsis sp. NC0098]